MKKARPFIAPRFALPLAWSIDLGFPYLLKAAFNIDEIVIDESDRRMLRGLREDRLLHFSNHPTFAEPAIAYHVANEIGSRFQYMASRTVFDRAGGLMGEVIRWLGAFSVIAGAADREAIKTARNVLARPRGKLVLYPEGMNNWENDNMVPFQSGAAQIGFWGLEDARKRDPAADITVLPSFVKYVMSGSPDKVQRELKDSLARLERKLKIDPAGKNLLRRFLTVGRVLLEKEEANYGVTPAADAGYGQRLENLRHRILDQIADEIRMPGYDRSADTIAKIRQLYIVVESVNAAFPDPRLASINRDVVAACEKKLYLAYNFSVIRPEYLLERPTAERFYEWLYRIERMVLGETHMRPRRAHMIFGRNFPLSDYYDAYKQNKRDTVEALTRRLRRDLEDLLDRSFDLTAAIVRPYDAGADIEHLYARPG